MALSSVLIGCIQKSCQKFIDNNYNDEIIFFDDIWEIYEAELKRWLNKPPKKWRFRLPKRKRVKYLSISDSTQAIDLTTPKVIEVISASFFQVAGLGENISLEKIEEIINTYGKKLSSELGLKVINYFAPIMLEDLEKMKLVPKEEEKKEYVLYSHHYSETLAITKEEYQKQKEELQKEKNDYLIFIDEVEGEFYIYGDSQNVPATPKEVLKFLIKRAGKEVKYRKLFKAILEIEPGNEM